ncbi:MAG: S9 family peptidase [Actinobacteria bacterium]|nr:S9 family peptidase [Actinomycetota bacterium]
MPDLDRYLDIRSASGGVATSDGATVVFVTTITGVPQAWSVPAGGGWPTQLTYADQRVGGVAASPTDPSLVVFSRDAGGNERMQLLAVDPSGFGERPLVEDPAVIHRFGDFGPDGTWFVFCDNRRNGVDFDLYRRSLDGQERLVAELPGWNSVAEVSPDGRAALVGHFESNVDSSVWLVSLDGGEVVDLTPHDEPRVHAPVGFDDAGRIYLVSDRDGEFRRAYRLAGGAWTPFGPADADVDDLAVRGSTGVVAHNAGGAGRMARFDTETLEEIEEVALPMGVAVGLSPAPDGSCLFTFAGPRHNADVWRLPAGAAVPERVTRSSTAGIDPGSFVEPHLDAVASFDGLEVPVWVYPAAGGGDRVIVSVHGGPEAQERPGFNPVYQYLAASGYTIVAPNVRGSSGYGRTYQSLDDRRRRMDSVADLQAVGRWVQAGGLASAGRMAVMGGSYGGFMVLAALATEPDLWAAGVDIVGIANFVTFLENTGDYRRALREAEYGSLAEDREFLESISPISMVERITAPLLVLHGANDPRVPVGEARQIAGRLRGLGRDVELLVFEDEGHGIVKLPNRRVAYRRVVEFLDDRLG